VVDFRLNGEPVSVDVPNDSTLLFVLTDDLGVAGVKFGCGLAQCGACTALIDGQAVRTCQTPVSAAAGRRVTTLAGLRNPDGSPGPLQQAFIDEQAAQCGYCISGIITQAQALLDANPRPTESEVRSALNGNLCRCGGHNRMVRAVLRAAQEMAV
jgi:nicotinate dehydrogenase subunit A